MSSPSLPGGRTYRFLIVKGFFCCSGFGFRLNPLDHVGRRLADPGVDVRLLIINGADLVVGEAVLLVVGVVLHWTQNISWKLLSFLHNRDYILCEYRETVKLTRPNH